MLVDTRAPSVFVDGDDCTRRALGVRARILRSILFVAAWRSLIALNSPKSLLLAAVILVPLVALLFHVYL